MPMTNRSKFNVNFSSGGVQAPSEVLAPAAAPLVSPIHQIVESSDESDDEFTGVRLPQAVSTAGIHYVAGSPTSVKTPEKEEQFSDEEESDSDSDSFMPDEEEVEEAYRFGGGGIESLQFTFAATSLETMESELVTRSTKSSSKTMVQKQEIITSSQYGKFDITDFSLASLNKKKKKKATMALLNSVSDEELREQMLTTYANDRQKKKARKLEREKLRGAGLLGLAKTTSGGFANVMKDTVDLRQIYIGDEMDLKLIKMELRNFLEGDAFQ
jgi:hypothetical protein